MVRLRESFPVCCYSIQSNSVCVHIDWFRSAEASSHMQSCAILLSLIAIEGRGKREDGRRKREEGRGKREEGRVKSKERGAKRKRKRNKEREREAEKERETQTEA